MGWGGQPCRDGVPCQCWGVCSQGRGLPANAGLRGSLPQPFTMRPASTVGTSVSLLPSPTPNSCSFPELSRLRGGRKEEGEAMPRPRQGRDSEAESAGEGYAYVVETGVHRPHPFLVSRSRAPSLCGGWRSDPGSPMLAVQTPYSKEPQFWTGTLQLRLSKALFHHPGTARPLAHSPHPGAAPL